MTAGHRARRSYFIPGLPCLPAIALTKAGAKARDRGKNKKPRPSGGAFVLFFVYWQDLDKVSVWKRCSAPATNMTSDTGDRVPFNPVASATGYNTQRSLDRRK